MNNKKFSPCPSSPNCVSSLSEDRNHAVEPLRYTGTRESARQKIVDILENSDRVQIVEAEENYIHAEFRSAVFKFVDDVEFLFSDEEDVVHVRSASRLGYSDFGANRKRVERLRLAFEDR